MRDIASKQDDVGDTLSASDFNSDQAELENAVLSSDQSLDPAGGPDVDLYMLAKAMSAYANAGATYVATGTANAIVLNISASVSLVGPKKYYDGMLVTFKAGLDNTGAVTVNVNSLGIKDVTLPDGSALSDAEIESGRYESLVYNETDDRFELIKKPYSEKIYVAGDFTISVDTGAWVDNGSYATLQRLESGEWIIFLSIFGESTVSAGSHIVTVSGIEFAENVVMACSTAGTYTYICQTASSTDDISITFVGSSADIGISGHAKLTGKPSWA